MSQPTHPAATVSLTLSSNELELIRTALGLLESTLGREQAGELHDVKALLARIESSSATTPGAPA